MRIFTVDAFTDIPFKGNPAGVCVLDTALTDGEYLNIAQEINLSETAFVYPENEAYQLKWFTPTVEVDICGHATLATAKILFEKYNITTEQLDFHTRSGVLTVSKINNRLVMNFPLEEVNEVTITDTIIEAFLGKRPLKISSNKDWCLIELDSDEFIQKFTPNLSVLLKHEQKAFIITAKSADSNYDFVSRLFAPAMGIDEDPVTGSAHCYLANYWGTKLSKNKLIGYQASKRGGIVECELIENKRVLLKGDCVIMSELLIEWNK